MQRKNYALTDGRIITPETIIEHGTLLIENGLIAEVSDQKAAQRGDGYEEIKCAGMTIMAGFIDLHTHGGKGDDFVDDSPGLLQRLSEYYYSHGVTTLLATLSPLPHTLLGPAVTRIAEFILASEHSTNLFGIHLEGPYINPAMIGGNRKEYVENPDLDEWRKIRIAGRGQIRLMTVAPELSGIDAIIDDALTHGVAISVGHTAATGNVMVTAIAQGARQVTHLFNSMPTLHHRETGILSEALLSDEVDVQLIADGIHVHPRIVTLAIRLKTSDHVLVITDSTRAAGLADGEFVSAGRKVTVRNGVVRAEDGTLAGSTLTMERAFAFLTEIVGTDPRHATRMMSLNAARRLGIAEKTGSLSVGKKADLVVLDDQKKVNLTFASGEIAFRG